jgi:hypothetical protein
LLLKLILFLAAELEMVRRFSETLAQASSVAVAQLRQIGSGRTCTTKLCCAAHLRQILEALVQGSSCMLLISGGGFWKD